MKLIKFKREMFEEGTEYPKGWHVMNEAAGQQGEFTLCGIAFDGDAVRTEVTIYPEYKNTGTPTCENCIAVIKFCKAIKL